MTVTYGAMKLKVLPKFPSNVIGRTGIDVTLSSGDFYLDLDVSKFPKLSSITGMPNLYVLLYDAVANVYYLSPTSTPVIFAADAKIAELEARIAALESVS